MASPTSRSLAKLRKDGWLCCVVEKFSRFPPPGHRIDAFGFGDILCARGDETLLVQATDGTSVSKRVEKIKHIPAADFWLQSSTRRIEVHGWRLAGKKGTRKKYECRVVHLGYDDEFGVYAMDEKEPL